MAIGRAARRAERAPLVEPVLGKPQAAAALDLLELLEYAWHDTDGEITPPDDVILNILICCEGSLAAMARAALLAVADLRDLQLSAGKAGSRTRPGNEERHPSATERAARRAERAPLVESVLGKPQAAAGLDLLELTDYAWHDCYEEITPSDRVILNILTCSRGDLATLVRAARLAVQDLAGPSAMGRARAGRRIGSPDARGRPRIQTVTRTDDAQIT